MKKMLFLISHKGSGSNILRSALENTPRVQFFETNMSYSHISDVELLTSYSHKLSNAAAIWAEELLYNFRFQNKNLYKFCKFIYFIRDGKSTLNELVKNKKEAESTTLYYTYRLRRIFEMARKTPNAIWMTWDDLASGKKLDLIEKYLFLREPLSIERELLRQKSNNNMLNRKQIDYAERAYERYYYKLSQLDFSLGSILG